MLIFLRNDVINMSREQDKEKSDSSTGINLRPSKHWSDAPTTELRRTHDFVIQYTRFMYDMHPTY